MNRTVAAGLGALLLTFMTMNCALAEQPGIRCVQNQLDALGFKAGVADGTIGTATRAAAEEYRAWMSGGAGGAGWSQPPLTALNGEFWCQKVREAHPEVAKFGLPLPQTHYEVSPGELVATFGFAEPGTISAWKVSFEYRTQCENDHKIVLTSPSGQSVVLMDRGLKRCSGRSTVFSGNGGDTSNFVGSAAAGTWKFTFEDLDANRYTGALDKVQMQLTTTNAGTSTKQTVSLAGLPISVQNPN